MTDRDTAVTAKREEEGAAGRGIQTKGPHDHVKAGDKVVVTINTDGLRNLEDKDNAGDGGGSSTAMAPLP